MKLSRRAATLTVACVVIGATIVVLFFLNTRLPTDIRYLERVTALKLPKGVSQIETARPREFCLSGKLKLPTGGGAEFVRTAGFTDAVTYPMNSEFGIDVGLFTTPVSSGTFLKLEGRSKTHRWEFAYAPADNILWFVLLFPDAHGDVPP
jgi:hypothetical protein